MNTAPRDGGKPGQQLTWQEGVCMLEREAKSPRFGVEISFHSAVHRRLVGVINYLLFI